MKVLDTVRDVIGLLVLEGTIEKSLGGNTKSKRYLGRLRSRCEIVGIQHE